MAASAARLPGGCAADRQLALAAASRPRCRSERSLGPRLGWRRARRDIGGKVASVSRTARDPACAVARQILVQPLPYARADYCDRGLLDRFAALVVGGSDFGAGKSRCRGVVSTLDRSAVTPPSEGHGRPDTTRCSEVGWRLRCFWYRRRASDRAPGARVGVPLRLAFAGESAMALQPHLECVSPQARARTLSPSASLSPHLRTPATSRLLCCA